MSKISDLHDAVKRGDLAEMKALLEAGHSLANARSETDIRGTYPLHVAAEFGQAHAAPVATRLRRRRYALGFRK